MRTTLTLEPDVAQEVRRLQAASGRSLKRVVNDLLRAGHVRRGRPAEAARAPAPTEPVACGGLLVPASEFDSVGALLARMDLEAPVDPG